MAANSFGPTPGELRRSRFSQIIRMDLEDDHGQLAGKIKDFILSRRTGRVRFGIVVSGGTFGLGRLHKVVPAATLNSNTAKTSAIGLSVSRFKLAEAFDFKHRELAALQHPGRAKELDLIFGLAGPNLTPVVISNSNPITSPGGVSSIHDSKKPSEEKLELASELIGQSVTTLSRQRVGKVADLLVDPSGHRPTIAIVSSSRFLKRGNAFTIPVRRLSPVDKNVLSTDAELIAFDSAPKFDLRAWENGTLSDTICSYNDLEPGNTRTKHAAEIVSKPIHLEQSEATVDLRITQQIRQEIAQAPGLSFTARNVTVVTKSGEVTLRGPVLTSDEKARILVIARETAGVSQVKDELEVK